MGFVLAGGKSSRMGEDKAFLDFRGQTLLDRALNVLGDVCDRVAIVGDLAKFVNYGASKGESVKRESVNRESVKCESVVSDIFPGCGPLAGIHAALAHSSAELNLMLAVDMPFVTPELLEFLLAEEINNYLLRDPEVRAYIASRGGRPKVAMVFFDDETERICAEQGYDLILPSDALRQRLDSKIVTTVLGNEAGAHSVPNVLVEVDSWDTLVRVAVNGGLGTDLVVQTPYGDSGKTTFFMASESEWAAHADHIVGQQAKVMKRINNKALAVEAVLTRHGTVVGPFMTDLTGYPELTPYPGGWCGNDLFPEALSEEHRARAIELVQRLGGRLRQEGYIGFFEVDILIDLDTDEVYLGELNPRFSGVSSITNVTAGAYADIPLFLFHLLEYMDVDYVIDVEEINERWHHLAGGDVWAQLIMKEPNDSVERILSAPRTGTYRLDAGREAVLPPGLARLAPGDQRGRVLLPARLRSRRLPLQGRGPRHPRHQMPHADR